MKIISSKLSIAVEVRARVLTCQSVGGLVGRTKLFTIYGHTLNILP